ncbi:CAP domain-containing protein [Puia sp. P3]|uniref:CAP domain-containing protein n=1 Tax=Puia sp. P3 TaxID=3423952 RepID=UPI003D665B8B
MWVGAKSGPTRFGRPAVVGMPEDGRVAAVTGMSAGGARLAGTGISGTSMSAGTGISGTSMSADILRYVNEYRHRKGLKPLQANSYISSVALQHSRDMLDGRTPFGHEGFHERIERIRKRLGPVHVAAENVASGPMSAKEVVDGWLHSPGHRRNIEGDFRLTGIGLAFGRRGMIYFTQIFAR